MLVAASKFDVVFLQNGKEVEKGHHLNIKAVTYDTAGTYVCVVTVPEIQAMQANASLQLTVQGESDNKAAYLELFSKDEFTC